MALPSACPQHRDLVAQALNPDAPDHVLEQYAEEVAACSGCKKALARDLQVHPVVLETASSARSLTGMEELYDALEAVDAPRRVRWPVWAAASATLAAAAAGAWMLVGPPPAAPQLTQAAPVEEGVPAERIVRPEPASPPPVVRSPVVPAPNPSPTPRSTPRPAPEQVVASASRAQPHDWPAPPFVELRSGSVKSASAVRSAQLVLGGSGPERHVGDVVKLTVVSSAPMEVAVCVSGPERGFVWRGGIPGGRVPLTQAERDVSFAFSAPGTYRFSLTTDVRTCTDPVHVVDVEVRG